MQLISGYAWFGSCDTLIDRKDKSLKKVLGTFTLVGCGRYMPETGFFQCHGGVYSPQLGQQVSSHKQKPKTTPFKRGELTGHITLIK